MNHNVDEDALVREHLWIAEQVTRKFRRKLPLHVDTESIYAAACEGLLNAIRNFNPNLGKPLDHWCRRKATTAVLDWLRSDSGCRPGKQPGKQQFLAARVSLDSHYVHPARRGPYLLKEALVGADAESVSQGTDLADLVEWAIRGLLPAERAMVTEYFLGSRTLKDVAGDYGLSESRGSQLLAVTLELLRERFGLLAHREDNSPSKREVAEQQAVKVIEKHQATVERIDGRIAVTIGPPNPLFPSPVICWGDDLAEAAAALEQEVARKKGTPILMLRRAPQ